MNLLLDSTAIGWSLFALAAGIGLLIIAFRYKFSKMGEEQVFKKSNSTISTRNKYTEVNVFKWSNTFLRIGMMMALTFVVLAFNYTTFDNTKLLIECDLNNDDIEIEIPRTLLDPPKPPPPPPPPPVVIEIPEDIIEDEPTFLDQEIDVQEEVIAPPPPPKAEAAPKPIIALPPDPVEDSPPLMFVEQMPRFPGCKEGDKKAKDACAQNKMLKFLYSKINYPALARENGVAGNAVIRFVVEKDGSLSEMQIVRDPGAGLGKEALRVVNLMANRREKWEPGRQNAVPVRVQFNLPIKFVLQ